MEQQNYKPKDNDEPIELTEKEQKLKDIEDIKLKIKQNDNRCPEEPDDEDCCGSGCTPCVFDLYYDRLEKYEEKK